MDIKIKCLECEQIFKASNETVERKTVNVLKDGAMIDTIQYKCPYCGKSVVVQLDNEETKSVLEKCRKLILKKVVKNRKGKVLSEKQQRELSELQDKLKEMRYDLAEKYDGCPVAYEVGEIETLDCTYIKDNKTDISKLMV